MDIPYLILLMFVFGMIAVVGRLLQSVSYSVAGIAGVVNNAALTLLEERVYQETIEIVETTPQQVWATLTVDRLNLALDYQDELEEVLADYSTRFAKEVKAQKFDIGAAYARAVVRIVVREFYLKQRMSQMGDGSYDSQSVDGEDE